MLECPGDVNHKCLDVIQTAPESLLATRAEDPYGLGGASGTIDDGVCVEARSGPDGNQAKVPELRARELASKVPDTPTHNFDVTAMSLALSWGSSRG